MGCGVKKKELVGGGEGWWRVGCSVNKKELVGGGEGLVEW